MAIHKDHLGREINLGDWCAMTQNNAIYVGKIIKISTKGAPTIARSSIEEYMATYKAYKKMNWRDQLAHLTTKFGPGHSCWGHPSWCRNGKFVKIKPTDDMIVAYDI
jgi:hypothetical protein